MKNHFKYFLPFIGIYFCIKYYFREGKRTAIEFWDSEEMSLYHFYMLALILLAYVYLTT